MLAKDILQDAVKTDNVEEAVLVECGNIASRATTGKSTPRLNNNDKWSFSSLLALPG